MKQIILILTMVALGVGFALSQQKKGREVTISGEVIDIQCYVSGAMGKGAGADHKECARDCAKGGIPLGILEDKTGTIYNVGQSKTAMKGANEMLMEYIAEKVTVTGRLVEKGGIKLILVSKVAKFASI